MIRDYYETPKSGRLMRLLWKAAGGDKHILDRATFADQMKYMCLGGVVTATGIMAALAGGFAFYTIFESKGSAIDQSYSLGTSIASCIFGILWGLMIFNIDRFIVTSTGKGDGTEAITWEEFKGAIPRIIMGAIIALTISKPVEIRMFKTEIDARLYEEQLKLQKEYEKRTTANFEERLKTVNGDLDKLADERKGLLEQIRAQQIEYNTELKGGNIHGPGDGPIAKAMKDQLDRMIADLANFDSLHANEIKQADAKRQQILAEKEVALSQNVKVANGLDGLLERIKLAHEIAGWAISLFITLLFMAIELTPIFFKLMLVKTPYDYLEDNIKELIKAENGIEVRYDYYKDKKGQERHLVINHQAERLIYEKIKATEAQKTLIDHAVEKYIELQKSRIDQAPETFIKQMGDGQA
ncbi:MAG TPA: DUF4407 domain-containing protein [Puia sp.]|nr:DUF4407 domain-containing protein [Puia sp.]